jgi:hypothetical protein
MIAFLKYYFYNIILVFFIVINNFLTYNFKNHPNLVFVVLNLVIVVLLNPKQVQNALGNSIMLSTNLFIVSKRLMRPIHKFHSILKMMIFIFIFIHK